ncbi:MAG: hypothetical protein LH618_12785, partial [Saprospiraceae bacterium]|nr:hypothetical protein [Saprospiraceae bacterium]
MHSLPEELRLLAQAVEGHTFHFVVVQWGHFSWVQRTKDYLRQQYPERRALSLQAAAQTYEPMMEQIYQLGAGFVFFDDFEKLLDNPDLCVAFNQRRGKLARLPLSVVCFLPPGARYVERCIQRLPDWWSVLSLLATLPDMVEKNDMEIKSLSPPATGVSTIGGPQQQ